MKYKAVADLILKECTIALERVSEKQVDALIEMLLGAEQVFFVGVGRVKMELEAFAKRLAHLGIKVHIVGDVNEPAMTPNDLLVVGSGSGESLIPVAIAKKAKQLGGKIIHIGSNAHSSLEGITDLMVRIPVQTKLNLKDEIASGQPMSSLFEQSLLLFGDTVSMMIVEKKNIELKKLWNYHANLE